MGLIAAYKDPPKGSSLSWPPAGDDQKRFQARKRFAWLTGATEDQIKSREFLKVFGFTRSDDTDYLPVPLARTMCEIKANLTFGEAPNYEFPGSDAEEKRGSELIKANGWNHRLKEVEEGLRSNEGAAVVRMYEDLSTPRGRDVPLFSFHSENEWILEFSNYDELLAGAYVQEFQGSDRLTYRLVEFHELGAGPGDSSTITTRLFRASKGDKWGEAISLSTVINATIGLAPGAKLFGEARVSGDATTHIYETGMEELWAAYVPNNRTGTDPHGVSDLDGLVTLFLAFNETMSAGHNTVKQAGAITIADERLLDVSGRLDRFLKAIRVKVKDAQVGGGAAPPFFEVKQFDVKADQFIAWQRELLHVACFVAGYDPSSIGLEQSAGGKSSTGPASGRALMLRNLRSMLQISGSSLFWEDQLAYCLKLAIKRDTLRYHEGHGGYDWGAFIEEPLTVTLNEGFPEDEYDRMDLALGWDALQVLTLEDKVRYRLGRGADEGIVQEKVAELQAQNQAQSDIAGATFKAALSGAITDRYQQRPATLAGQVLTEDQKQAQEQAAAAAPAVGK